ncbi:hypothetical protein OVY01_07650 [Robbsia sp. Bb-Pol-6]|uniref:Uncharacterized protein n=1 Tax=Robbsia betulipollinis TaxID=2981849 RepID=A0ABT3ZL84_9BURK|nr:hypothetical protein [Robbsia betulipollinis]MCY0387107.1 hypothetical protein [Robbsia betulipollinis]
MIDSTTRAFVCIRSLAMRQDLDDYAQRQAQRERALDALVHQQQKVAARLHHLSRDVHQLGDAMMRVEDRRRARRLLRGAAPDAPAGQGESGGAAP